jgi:gluconate kinase
VLISGAAGVGKSSTAFEMSTQLQAAGVAHALIDTDELDRIFPVPDDLYRLTERNLAAVWQGFREHGASRLIVVGVFVHEPRELAWLRRAIPDARFTLVRLAASPATLADRIERREVGSDLHGQLARTREQLLTLDRETRRDVRVIPTDVVPIVDTAAEILRMAGWLKPGRGVGQGVPSVGSLRRPGERPVR